MKEVLKKAVPPSLYRALAKRRYRLNPSPLDPWRRLAPVAPDSNSRGISVDRYYIESFLDQHRTAIRGRALEIADDTYTKRFGHGVTVSDVLTDPRSGATSGIIGDLRVAETLAPDTYDIVILTQTLQFIDKPVVALNNVYRALRRGGTALITVPGIAQRDNYDDKLWGDFYRWMPRGLRTLMGETQFDSISVGSLGNILTVTAFLYNMAIEDVKSTELSHIDDDYPLIVTCVAGKAV